MTTILHISDLHRDPKAPLANGPLLETVILALARCQEMAEPIGPTDLVVVSGDVVNGVPADGDVAELRAQYDQAEELLVQLADHLLQGRRDHVVIVPGNHDISFPTFVASLEPVSYDDRSWGAVLPQLFERDSNYRWSWRDRVLYRIVDEDTYLRRLEEFSGFYSRFYEGRRTYSLSPAEQFDIFDYPQHNLTVVGYSSCFTNDPWHRLGNIHPEALSSSQTALRSPLFSGRTLIAVWHHSVHGLPHSPDFMDEERVQILLAAGFTLGLHGHQHRSERLHTTSRFGQDSFMTVLSAGSLCAGPGALPAGRPRSFNVVELNVEAGAGRVHVQTMMNDSMDHPIWGPQVSGNGAMYIPFTVTARRGLPGADHRRLAAALAEAEELLRQRRPRDAVEVLRTHAEDPLARRVLFEAAIQLDNPKLIISMFGNPLSNGERIALMNALWEVRDAVSLRRLLGSPGIADSTDASVRQTRDMLTRKIEL